MVNCQVLSKKITRVLFVTLFLKASFLIFFCKYVAAARSVKSKDFAGHEFHKSHFKLKNFEIDNVRTKRFSKYKRSENITITAWDTNYRIPEFIKPENYDLTLAPNFNDSSFKGSVNVIFRVKEPFYYIPIHIQDLEVTETVLVNLKSRRRRENEVEILRTFEYKPNSFWIIQTGNANETDSFTRPGRYKLFLEFQSNFTTSKMSGFYRSGYVDSETNSLRHIATSKFEPTDARQAFPCFDEPSLKAKFKISLVRPKGDYLALSNTIVEKEVPGPGPDEVTVHFEETVPMSTYVTCFIVGEFKSLDPVYIDSNGKNISLRVYSTPSQVKSTALALEVVRDVTEFYIGYFGVPYPLPKLDLIAIPDFISGAMENWGLVTFRETNLVFDPTKNSAANQKKVATVISHELAHMWFGNLVTMKWWDDLWLNEGFASFMEYKGVDEGYPGAKDWNVQAQFLLDDLHPVLEKDANLASHPIIQHVEHPDQISALFDSISYDKGQAAIRMIEDMLTPPVFRKGIKNYLQHYKFSTASTDDLWSSLTKAAAGKYDVKTIMDTWTRQTGYPVVHVKKDTNKNVLVLTQQRFLDDPNAVYHANESIFGFKWDIPIRYHKSDDPSQDPNIIMFPKNSSKIEIPISSNTEWVKINSGQIGFYRVNYEPNEWDKFSEVLKANPKSISLKDRVSLIDDAFSLAGSGHLPFGNAFELMKYFPQENDYVPWSTGIVKLAKVKRLLKSTPVYPRFKKFVRALIENKYGSELSQFDWEVRPNDTYVDRMFRIKVLETTCGYGVSACLSEVSSLFKAWLNGSVNLHPDIRQTVYHFGMQSGGGEKEWDKLWELYNTEVNAIEKDKLLRGLASIQEPWILSRLIDTGRNESFIRSQDFFTLLGYITTNPVGGPIVWDFYRGQWEYLVSRFSLSHRPLARALLPITKNFSTKLKLEETKEFFQQYPEAGSGAGIRKQALETIGNNIQWLHRNQKGIIDWFSNQHVRKTTLKGDTTVQFVTEKNLPKSLHV